MVSGFRKDMFGGSLRGKIGYLFMKPMLEAMKKKIDHKEVGGAPLLGIDGAVFIAHGSSDERSIKSALRAARTFVMEDVNGHIQRNVAETFQAPAEENEGEAGIIGQLKKKFWNKGSKPDSKE